MPMIGGPRKVGVCGASRTER